MALALVVATPASAAGAVQDPAAYRRAVEATYKLVASAHGNDTGTARLAIGVLVTGTGQTQPEIVAALERNPPDFTDAAARLHALLDAIDHPAAASDPAQAQQQLNGVLSMHRYDALHRPPSLIDRFFRWVTDRLNDLLRLLFGRRGAGLPAPDWVFYALGVVAVALVALVVFRATRGRYRDRLTAGGPEGPRAPADYFAEADRFAAAGDRVRAIRALCAGVAATLAGERTWEGSPLTVREIFLRAPDPSGLRPLLIPFEAAVYGGREVDVETYERASQVAARFRRPVELAA